MNATQALAALGAAFTLLHGLQPRGATSDAAQLPPTETLAADLEATAGGVLRTSLLRADHQRPVRLRIERLAGLTSRGQQHEVVLEDIADASALRGGIDTRVELSGDLLVAASFAGGGDDVLHLWRIRQHSTQAAPQIVARGAFVDVPLTTDGAPTAESLRLCYFAEPQLIVGGQGLSVLVAASTARGPFVTTAPRSVVQLALTDDLTAIRSHSSITPGSSPRVHFSDGLWTLAVRQAGPLHSGGHAAPVSFSSSRDARTWTEMELPSQPPLARPDYAIGMSGRQPWLATSADDARSEVALWHCSANSPAWWVAGRARLTEGAKQLRGQSIWLPEPAAGGGQAPVLVLEGAQGLELTRW